MHTTLPQCKKSLYYQTLYSLLKQGYWVPPRKENGWQYNLRNKVVLHKIFDGLIWGSGQDAITYLSVLPVYKDDTDTRPYCLLILCRTVPIVWKEMDNVKRAENFRKGRIQRLADTGLFCSPLPVLACCADECAYIIRKRKRCLLIFPMTVSWLHGLCIRRDVWRENWMIVSLLGSVRYGIISLNGECCLGHPHWNYARNVGKGMIMRGRVTQADGTGTVPKF